MSFPPTLRDSADESIFGDDCIEIHVDPNSLPAPPVAPFHAINDNISDEEEEEEIEEDPAEDPAEEEEEEDPAEDSAEDPAEEEEEEDPVEEDPPEDPAEETPAEAPIEDPEQDMDATSGEPARPVSDDEPMEAVPSYYARGNRRTGAMRTARMSVRFPSYDFASTSRAHAPHHSPTPSVTPSPTPSRVVPPTPTSPIGYTQSSEPSSPAPLSPYSLPYSPDTQYGIPPSPAAEPQPPSSPSPASPHSPHPVPFETTDPVISSLRDNAYEVGNRISQIEQNLTEIPGPDSFDDLEESVQAMDRRMDQMSRQMVAMERRMAEQVRVMNLREGADRVEIHNLRRRLRILEDRFSGMYR